MRLFRFSVRFRQRSASGEQLRYPVAKATLSIERFSSKNWSPDNVEDGMRRNREWTD